MLKIKPYLHLICTRFTFHTCDVYYVGVNKINQIRCAAHINYKKCNLP